MAKTLTIRLSQNDSELVEWLKDDLLVNTASKALLEAARRYQNHAATGKALRDKIAEKNHRIMMHRDRLEEIRREMARLSNSMRSDSHG